MAKKTKKGKERLDKYYRLAKEHGYRSRAAFKLIQLNQKYGFLQTAARTVDLCAAPGGWCQVARKFMPITGEIVGVDLSTIKTISGVKTMVGDITTAKCLKQVSQTLGSLKADLVLHDGAPNVGANWLKDAFTQSELVLAATKMAVALLRPGGTFVTKVFRSADYNALLWVLRQLFRKVEATKPQASRYASAEIFVVCEEFKAPAAVDPKLLDPKYVFEQVTSDRPARLEIGWKETRRKVNREGYEDGAVVLHRSVPVAEFINSPRPVSILATCNQLDFEADEESRAYAQHPRTDKEIRILCDDLLVLGRIDFKRLMRWRLAMIRYKNSLETGLPEDKDEEDMSDGEDAGEEGMEVEVTPMEGQGQGQAQGEEEALIAQLEELRKAAERRRKKALKKVRARLGKLMPKGETLVERKEDLLDNYVDEDLFSLRTIKNKRELETALRGSVPAGSLRGGEEDLYVEAPEEVEEFEDYDAMMEATFDQLYTNVLEKTKQTSRRTLHKLREEDAAKRENLFELLEHEHGAEYEAGRAEHADDDAAQNPLLVRFGDKPKGKEDLWFSQKIFDELEDEDGEERMTGRKRKRYETKDDDIESEYSDDDSDDEGEFRGYADDDDGGDLSGLAAQGGQEDGDFEAVPRDMEDPETAMRVLALGTKALRKKERMELVDAAFNRYTQGDDEDLPQWFKDDELQHMRPQSGLTKEDVARIRQRFQELNERPMKKVLEAKMRKKMRAQKKLDFMREKAMQIADSEEMTPNEKAKELRTIYNQAMGKGKISKVYVVGRKHIRSNVAGVKSGKVKLVDPRMKKDLRAESAEGRKRKKTRYSSRRK